MDIYEELNIKRLINAAGTYTVIGGSKMSETTLRKMSEIASSNVEIRELQNVIHKNLAKITKNEASIITAGAIVGIYLALASTISLKYKKQFKYLNKKQIEQSEIIMFKAHRNPYDRSISLIGCKLVELGYANNIDSVDEDTLENAINENTCAIFYVSGNEGGWIAEGALNLDATIKIANKYNVPVIVDAAAQLPPKANLWDFTLNRGATAVIFSGGKYLKGPQSTGLVLGRKDLLLWIDKNNFPNYDIGRMHKISREDLVGLYQAVKEYIKSDEEKEIETANRMVEDLIESFQYNSNFYFERSYPNEAGQPMPRAKLIIINEKFDSNTIRDILLAQNKAIYTKIENNHIYINPMMLSWDEYKYVKSILIEISEENK